MPRELFKQLEKPKMRPLPEKPFEIEGTGIDLIRVAKGCSSTQD